MKRINIIKNIIIFLQLIFVLLPVITQAQPLDIRLAKIYKGENGGDRFGSGMGAAGDINGDGYMDFMIGARFWPAGGAFGRVYIYLGGDSIPEKPSLILDGPAVEVFGFELGGVGDLNGDGYDDYAISSTGIIDAQGAVRLYWGGDTLSSEPFAVLRGSENRELFGFKIRGGDFNNDGYSDLVIGAPSSDGSSPAGHVNVYFGSENFDTIPDWRTNGTKKTMELGFTLKNGDLNADGFDDLLIGEHSFDSTLIHIFYGGADFDSEIDLRIINDDRWYDTGDITGDGIDDLVLWDRTTETHAVFYGGADFDDIPDDYFDFAAHTVSIGHFDRDGIKDVVMGNSFSNRVRVYKGGFPIDKTADWATRRGDFLSAYGHPVLSIGDVNGDGADDFLVSEIFGGTSGDSEGQVYLYLGDSAFVVSIEPEESILPTSYLTLRAYPNPFNGTTTIAYSVLYQSKIQLRVFNIRGELVKTLLDAERTSGEFSASWDGKDFSGNSVASGIYIAHFLASGVSVSRKLLLLK